MRRRVHGAGQARARIRVEELSLLFSRAPRRVLLLRTRGHVSCCTGRMLPRERSLALLVVTTLLLAMVQVGCDCPPGVYTDNKCSQRGGSGSDPIPMVTPPCSTAQLSCNGSKWDRDGCETNVHSDPLHCGGCDMACPGGAPVCVSGSCTVACEPGKIPCAGACVDSRTDADNCGSCGIACQGACNDGWCTGEVVLSVNEQPFGLVCEGDTMAWSSSHSVMAARVDGTDVQTLAERGGHVLAKGAGRVASSGMDDGVFSVPLAGGPTTVIAEGTGAGFDIVADQNFVYFADVNGVRRAPIAGGPAETLIDAASIVEDTPLAFAIDEDVALYVGLARAGTNEAHILRLDLAVPGAPIDFGPSLGEVYPRLAVHAGAVVATRRGAGGAMDLVRIDAPDAEPIVLASAPTDTDVIGVYVAGGSLFFTAGLNLIELPLEQPGAAPVHLAHETGGIRSVCLLGDDLYFAAVGERAIKRIRREP